MCIRDRIGDVDAALDDIDDWCREQGMTPIFGVVPEEEREHLMNRYPCLLYTSRCV